MSIRPKIEVALSATAERLRPGAGADVLRHFTNDLQMIETSSDNLSRRFANDDVALALPVIFEAKHPEGDPVAVGKKHDGIIVIFPDSLVFVRGIGFGAREVKALSKGEITVEPVTLALEGAAVPGLRLSDRRGKPKFAVAVVLLDHESDPSVQQALRDEAVALLAG